LSSVVFDDKENLWPKFVKTIPEILYLRKTGKSQELPKPGSRFSKAYCEPALSKSRFRPWPSDQLRTSCAITPQAAVQHLDAVPCLWLVCGDLRIKAISSATNK